MASDHGEEARRLFEAALQLDPAARAQLLEGIEATNPKLREAIDVLLAEHAASPHAPEMSAPARSEQSPTDKSTVPASDSPAASGLRIGPYRVLQEIGKGGMGIVYEAEQDKPVRRKVALKLIKWGMDTREVIARFESERQALALMNHTNIASVYEAGATEQGRPYFAMELVHGDPITHYCDKNKLTIPERLELFFQVCEGVQHAHQKGIIHRDLKPSNILVTIQDKKPIPKVIDFGVAKATSQRLTENTVYTELGQLIGTPEYMSPEQAEMSGQNIDTRTDVYALGVILYQLLVGALPFDSKELRQAGYDEIRRRIREDDPPRPSTRVSSLGPGSSISAKNRRTELPILERQLRGDLDWIIMKTLEKDRTRRYSTPGELADDLRRFLAHQPVLATPPSAAYRTRKFVRRNRVAVAFAGLILVALVTLATTMTFQAQRIAKERDRANREKDVAVTALDFLAELFEVADPSEARGNTITAREILDQGAARVDEVFGEQPEVRSRLLGTIGCVYQSLGLYAEAEGPLREALEIQRQMPGRDGQELAFALEDLGNLLLGRAEYAAAEELFREALEIRRKVFGDEHIEVAHSLNVLAGALRLQGNYEAAAPLYSQSLAMARKLLDKNHEDLPIFMNDMANLLADQGDAKAAAALYQEVLAQRRKQYGTDHPALAFAMDNLAMVLHDQGDYEAAEPLYREALAILRKIYGSEHPEVAQTLGNFSFFLVDKGDYKAAESMIRESLAIHRKLLADDHPSVADNLADLADLLHRQGNDKDAEPLVQEALRVYRSRLPAGHMKIVNAESVLGAILAGLGRVDEAEPLLIGSFESMRTSEERAPEIRRALERAIAFYDATNRPEQAAAYRALLDDEKRSPGEDAPHSPEDG